jgi:GAF domain-containing protein
LAKEAIATGQIQVSLNVPKDSKLAGVTHYQEAGVQALVIIPIIYRHQIIAVLSLQWKQPCTLREDELRLIDLSAQLVAIALTSSRCHTAKI